MFTLELIAAAGFVVAAPSHVGNAQDDVRIDFVNDQAMSREDIGTAVLPCRDELPSPCARTGLKGSMQDRAGDISATLDHLPR